MQFIEDDEALSHPPPASPHSTPPVPSQPFPFLTLPREIRDLIYHYALLRPKTGPGITPSHICAFRPQPDIVAEQYIYWGTEKSTRLFLVNRQFSYEALKLFYSSYPFNFAQTVDVALVNATLRDTLSPWARSLISSISLIIILRCTPDPFTASDEEERRLAIEAMVALLPNVKRFELTLTFVGVEVPEYQVKEIVSRGLRIASPLKDVAKLVLYGADHESAQRMRITREVREALGCM